MALSVLPGKFFTGTSECFDIECIVGIQEYFAEFAVF